METFPAIVPDHPATKEVKPREQRQPLGDGLEYVVRFGLNPMDVTWRLTWARLSVDELFEIEQFLEARAADGQPFLWTPPDTSTAQAFRVDQWEPARSKPTSSSLDLVFRRVYEVADPTLPSIGVAEDALIPDVAPALVSSNGLTRFRIVSFEYFTGEACGDTKVTPPGYPAGFITADVSEFRLNVINSGPCGPTQVNIEWISRSAGPQGGSGFTFFVNGSGITRAVATIETEIISGTSAPIISTGLTVLPS